MIPRYLLALALALAMQFTQAQTCLKLKPGQKITNVSYRYANDQVFMPAWAKMKDSKRDEAAMAFNAQVASGALKGTPGSYVSTVKAVSNENGIERAATTMELGGKQYTSLFACINDTMYFNRIAGINYSIDAKGDTIGFGTLGAQVIPNKLKVGDVLAPYEDVGMTFPVNVSKIERQRILLGVTHRTYQKKDQGFDSQTGQYGMGTATIHETTEHWETKDVEVKYSLQFTNSTINYALARVTGEEEVTIDGVKHKAFRIDSESWTKGTINKSYESNDAEWKKARAEADAKLQALMDKRGSKKGYTNSAGYVVTYRTEWFVPTIGVAKMDIYDNYGFILSHSELASIK